MFIIVDITYSGTYSNDCVYADALYAMKEHEKKVRVCIIMISI